MPANATLQMQLMSRAGRSKTRGSGEAWGLGELTLPLSMLLSSSRNIILALPDIPYFFNRSEKYVCLFDFGDFF